MHCGNAWLDYVKAPVSLCIQAMIANAATQKQRKDPDPADRLKLTKFENVKQ